jgi:hypothetical protein
VNINWAEILLGFFGFIIVTIVAGGLIWRVLEWWDSVWGPVSFGPEKPPKTYDFGKLANKALGPYKPKKVEHISGLLASDRRNPPRAEFFGRLDGERSHVQGPWEEKYLNTWEKKHWDKQKELADELKLDSNTKTAETEEVVDIMGQTCEKLIDIAPKEVKNGKKA